MADGWVLIDTSAWIHALRSTGDPLIRNHIRRILNAGHAATCEMVILELMSGTRKEIEYQELREDLESLQQFPITKSVWTLAYRLAHTLQRKGISIPSADNLIASVALTYPCRLLHSDRHFDILTHHVGIPVWRPSS